MKIFLLRIGVLLASILFSLGMVEIFLRQSPTKFEPITSVYNYSQFNIEYGIEPKPKLKYDEYGVQVRTNSDATFGPEVKKDGTPAIFHLGDSYSAGPGVAYEKNYPHLLTEMINASSSAKYQTVILGMGGSSPAQQSRIYKKKLTNIKPALTVYELYQNDLRDDYVYYYSVYRAKSEMYESFPKWLLQTRVGEKMFIFLSDRKAKEFEKKYNETTDILKDDPKYVWDLVSEPALDEIKKTADERGSPLIIFYIPLGWEFDDEYSTASAQPRDPWYTYAEKWARDNKIPYVNMYEDFRKVNTEELNELYLDGDHGYHLTEKGTRITAEKLFELVQKNKLLD